jgi:hypothetical protein
MVTEIVSVFGAKDDCNRKTFFFFSSVYFYISILDFYVGKKPLESDKEREIIFILVFFSVDSLEKFVYLFSCLCNFFRCFLGLYPKDVLLGLRSEPSNPPFCLGCFFPANFLTPPPSTKTSFVNFPPFEFSWFLFAFSWKKTVKF